MPGLRGVVFEVTAQAHDEVVNGAGVGVFAHAPHFLQHTLARYGFAFVLDQEAQDAGFHQRQRIDFSRGVHFQKIEVDGFFAELFGKESGPGKGKAGSMHLCRPDCGLMATSAVVATTIPLAVGAALANAYRKDSTPVAVFFGDGAVEEGVFWESVNFACLHRLNVLFVCEDNGLAIHAHASERRGYRSLIEVLQGFRCTVVSADGSDLPTVVQATRNMLSRMTQDRQPGFLHLSYFRLLEHVGIQEDFAAGYRSGPSPEEWRQVDPVERLRAELSAEGYSSRDLEAITTSIDVRIAASIARARAAAYPPIDALYEDVLA